MKKTVCFKFNSGNRFRKVENIYLAGDFNHWNEKSIPVNSSNGVTLDLDYGIYEYKFIVNGEWLLSEGAEITLSSNGMRNNIIKVTYESSNIIDTLQYAKPVCFKFSEGQIKGYSYGAILKFMQNKPQCFVVGEFNDWNTKASQMTRNSDGTYYYQTYLYPGKYRYKYYASGIFTDDYGRPNSLFNWFRDGKEAEIEENEDYRFNTHVIRV